jgi:hypothetical protein
MESKLKAVSAKITLFYGQPLSIEDRKTIVANAAKLIGRKGFAFTTSTFPRELPRSIVRIDL